MFRPIHMLTGSAALCAAVAATVGLAGPAFADGVAPSYVTFDKHYVGSGQFVGTTGGAAPGTVHTSCSLAPENAVLVQLACDWRISAGEHSFDAPMTGTLNWETGVVVMNGQVASGWQAGAQVHESGKLVDPAALEFVGTIRIEP